MLRGPGYTIPSGEGAIGFFYGAMQWEAADTQGGSGGFCPTPSTGCTPGAAGFGDGQSNGATIAGSMAPGIAAVLQNRHVWFDLNGGVPSASPTQAVPALGTVGLVVLAIALFGAAALWLRRRESHAV